ncbi:type II toxin-antitoxin system RelE family toxin [Aminicella lysinilytica]|uniref:mRNA interferase RelE/StbE n=1 Tax=Aminicella lysinilytica TaxID=433323 RepID=A0A4R6PXZ1_9FIRM|nr:type II toxin-antitoxin system RelE/ParE family toxin [Aminicella lysinilytica]TDP44234.1 mRNA interferase RelE/StbE [Aminicella lysinilytica]
MTEFHVEFTEKAKKQLKKLDKHTAALILGWIRKNLEGCNNPRQQGKGLSANRSGEWRYRVGDYRIIAEIMDDRIVILVLSIGHRSDVYKGSIMR